MSQAPPPPPVATQMFRSLSFILLTEQEQSHLSGGLETMYAILRTDHAALQANNLAEINEKDLLQLKVTMDDFQYALGEVKPAFGVAEDEFADCLVNGIVNWGPDVQVERHAVSCSLTMLGFTDQHLPLQRILDDGKLFAEQVRNSQRTPLVSVLLEGTLSGLGPTVVLEMYVNV